MTGALIIIGACATLFALLWRRALRQLDAARVEGARSLAWARVVVAECDERREVAKRCIACRQHRVVLAHERLREQEGEARP